MTSPVSIGDAFLMAKLALNLGRAFTTGRKSAPAEFREVENQLYSISSALSSLGSACNNTRDGGDALESMLQGCEECLKHLETIVEKYSTIAEPKGAGGPLLRKWTTELKRSWKKVRWTTEGGDLATLRSQLTVHINCLNLVLGVVNHSQTDRVGNQVNTVASMIQEIHAWFVDNLQGHTTNSIQTESVDRMMAAGAPLTEIQFELYAETPDGQQALCLHASLHPKWDHRHQGVGQGENESLKQLFQCNCPTQLGQALPHAFALLSLGLSPFSFGLRLAGSTKKWMIHRASDRTTNRLNSLIIKNIPASRTVEFEKTFIDVLVAKTAGSMLRRNKGTMLAYLTLPVSDQASETRILNMMSDLQQAQKQIETVTFTIGRQSYARSLVETIQLLHYKTLKRDSTHADTALYPESFKPMETADLVIFYTISSSDNDVTKTVIHLKHSTMIRYEPGDSKVLVRNVDCTGIDTGNEDNRIGSVDVLLQFATPNVAEEFRNRIMEMKVELFVMSLNAPRSYERLALTLQVGGVHTEDVDLPGSEMSIVQSEISGRLRLIIVSNDGGTILSQELAEDFITATGGRPNFKSPTYVVQILGTGVRKIRRYDKGFEFFEFSDVQMDRLFSLGLAAVSGQSMALT